jgi:ornithine cyclodeaminase
MRFLSAAELARAFTYPVLIEALKRAFQADIEVPVRHHHTIERPGEPAATLLLMPAWGRGGMQGFVGIKLVTIYPGNGARDLPSVAGLYVLLDASTGTPLATLDGQALTLWRTAAASALAASYLARPETRRMVMVGAGALAPHLIAAHATVRPIEEVLVWNHRAERAEALAAALAGRPYTVRATTDLEAAIRDADLVSCATLAVDPLVAGAWLKPGVHLDLLGAFTPAMRECDDEAIRRAHIFVDTRAGAMKEAGDIVQPLESGLIEASDIAGDLSELCRGSVPGRPSADAITLFKSVGTALEDLAAAALAYESTATG